MTVTASRTWADLSAHRLEIEKLHLRDFFARDPQRAGALSLSFEDILYDFSKQRLTPETIGLLVALASEAFVPEWIERMFGGERINVSEGRSVLHVALRRSAAPFPDGGSKPL